MKEELDKIAKLLNQSEDYEKIVLSGGWEKLKSDLLEEADDVGKYAVYPGFKKEVLSDRLLEARTMIKLIQRIEGIASDKEHLKNQLDQLKG